MPEVPFAEGFPSVAVEGVPVCSRGPRTRLRGYPVAPLTNRHPLHLVTQVMIAFAVQHTLADRSLD